VNETNNELDQLYSVIIIVFIVAILIQCKRFASAA
jgi:hypothetical protein